MEDLGEAIENFVETFSCTEEQRAHLPEKSIPSTHGNLLVAPSLYGHIFAAVGSSIIVYSNASLREGNADPIAVVDLKEEHVTSIHALALGAHDTIIAQVTLDSKCSIVILNIPAVAAGKIHALPGPSGIVSAFSVSDAASRRTPQVLATLETEHVQLHDFAADGTTPTTKVNIQNARCIALSPEGDLLAVGTGRGSVIIYATKSGETCAKIVEVESGWEPFSTHFADNRSVLVSYNCETEVRHVVWHLSPDSAAVTGHSPLGELCLALVSFDDDEPNEAPVHPMMTYISLHDWSMCVIGSSMSSDVEIIRKTDSRWEVWKFDEGKSPTLPTDDNDDDTCCVGLAFDLNNTALIPGPDAASPKINPMPRVIVYTSDSLMLPFALIDSSPGVKCDAVDSAMGFPVIPVSLRSIQSAFAASLVSSDLSSATVTEPGPDSTLNSKDPFHPRQKHYRPSPSREYDNHGLLTGSNATKESDRKEQLDIDIEDSIQPSLSRTSFGLLSTEKPTSSNFGNESRSPFSQKQGLVGVNSFLDNFSFKEAKEHAKPTTGFSTYVSRTMRSSSSKQYGTPANSMAQEKQNVSLAPSLDVAEAEANGGDLLGLLKSIMAEMSEELKVSAEAEQVVSQEIAMQKDLIVCSIAETRQQLTKLLQDTRALFQNEVTLRSTVSSTLSKVLSLSREYEKMSLEFHVKEADGFSRSLRTEDKEIDDKIEAKEAEVLRSISSIGDRLNAEAEIQTRRRNPAELVQQVYSSLSLQGIRIKRVRSLLMALNERMDNQDKGGRLSHLGLSLARLEKLNINDEDTRDRSQSPDKSKIQESANKEAVGTPNSMNDVFRSHSTNNQGDDTQLLSSDVRAVMRRLAMSGGRASINITVSPSRTKRGRIITLKEEESVSEVTDHQTTAFGEWKATNFTGPESSNATSTVRSGPGILDFTVARVGDIGKTERADSSKMVPGSVDDGMSAIDKDNRVNSSTSVRAPERAIHSDFTTLSSDMLETRNASARSTVSTLPSLPLESKMHKSQSTGGSDGAPSASLPPKRPIGQTFLPPSARQSSPLGSLLGSTMLRDKKQKDPTEITPEPSSAPSASRQGSGFGKIDTNASEEKSITGSPSSRALTLSTAIASVESASSPSVFRMQTLNYASSGRQASNPTNPSSVTPVADVENPTKSSGMQFAQLPPDGEDMKKSPIAESAPQVAHFPPDDDDVKPKPSILTSVPVPVEKTEALKEPSMSGFFAALPSDPDADAGPTPKSNDEKLKKPRAAQGQETETIALATGNFAALPPDSDAGNVGKQVALGSGEEGRRLPLSNISAVGSSGGLSSLSTKKESLGTSDLFAALPPDDSGNEQVQATRTTGGSPFQNSAETDMKATEDSAAIIPAVTNENDAKPRAGQPLLSTFADGGNRASTEHSQTTPFASPFGATQQSTAAFGNASLFGASSPANQSAPVANTSAPEGQSSRDGTSSDDSEGESRRFGSGMDTSSGGGGFFGASSPAQGIQEGFGFGSRPDSAAGATAFGQSSVSPFGALSQSQPFGQSTLAQPPAQTGFGSLAGSQESVPSAFQTAQPSFGASSPFGAANSSSAFGMDSTFGAESQIGAPSSFGVPSQLGMSSTPFSSSNPTFGGGMPEPTFGEASFGATSSFGNFAQNSATGGFENSSSAPSASPFGSITGGSGFGGASGGGSGFAALAGTQSGSLVFGNGGGPPSFTSAAFSQRRA